MNSNLRSGRYGVRRPVAMVAAGALMGAAIVAAGVVPSASADPSSSVCDALASNLVQDCGFELAGQGDQAVVPGWSRESQSQSTPGLFGVDADAHSGSNAVHFDLSKGTFFGLTTGDLATHPGAAYDVGFWSKNTGAVAAGGGASFDATVGPAAGAVPTPLLDLYGPDPSGWTEHAVRVTATATAPALYLSGYGSQTGPFTVDIDDVFAVPVQPGAPTDVTATSVSDSAVTVSWLPPADTGGSAIQGYTAQAYVGGMPVTGGSCSPDSVTPDGQGRVSCTVSPLGTDPVTFTVHATNVGTDGPESTPTDAVTPGQPGVTQDPSDAVVRTGDPVSFTSTASGTPAPTEAWEYSTDGGADWHAVAGATGSTYDVPRTTRAMDGLEVRAWFHNDLGDAYSRPATLDVDDPAAQPRDLRSVGGDHQVTVSWSAPGTDGGSAITGYTVTAPGTDGCSTTAALSCVVTGLTNGTKHTFTVVAQTAVGGGLPAYTSGYAVRAPVVTRDPSDVKVRAGKRFHLVASVSADPAPTARWQYSVDGGHTWRSYGSATTAKTLRLAVTARRSMNHWRFRAAFTDVEGTRVTTAAARLIVTRKR